MIRNYIKIAWRNLLKQKMYSAINIIGLALGMAVAILISLWIKDEISFNKNFKNYDQVVRFILNSFDGKDVSTFTTVSIPLAVELRDKYSADFKRLALSKYSGSHTFAFGDKKIKQKGN